MMLQQCLCYAKLQSFTLALSDSLSTRHCFSLRVGSSFVCLGIGRWLKNNLIAVHKHRQSDCESSSSDTKRKAFS